MSERGRSLPRSGSVAPSVGDAALRRLAEHTRALFIRALTEAELWQGLGRLLAHSAEIEAAVAFAAAPEIATVQTAPLRRVMLVGHLPFAAVAESDELARRVYVRPTMEIAGSAIALNPHSGAV